MSDAEDRIAAIVFDAGQTPARELARARARLGRPQALTPESLAGVALGPPVGDRRGLLYGVFVTLALHGCLAALAIHDPGEKPAKARAIVPPPLRIEHVVTISPPAPPEPKFEAPAPAAPIAARASSRPAKPSPAPAAPAQAGQVVATDKSADGPADFTGFAMTTGQATQYTGGVTARENPVHKPDPATLPAGAVSRAQPVRLRARDWTCRWPKQADALSINEQVVVVQVTVSADGSVAEAQLLSDPGHGFGAAARACAREGRRFDPALDDQGVPYAATSAPVRVRFAR